jgi:hypothetical protein
MILGTLVDEVKLWNTPIIGAFLLWRFTQGYCDNHQTGDAPIGLLHFVASAILISKELMKPISNKRANLQSYVRSFENTKNSDILISLQQQIIDKQYYAPEYRHSNISFQPNKTDNPLKMYRGLILQN